MMAAIGSETSIETCPFGWVAEPNPAGPGFTNPIARMTVDRWYPTLTTLMDGRVLISGGFSRTETILVDHDQDSSTPEIPEAQRSSVLEVYDPVENQTSVVEEPFPVAQMPVYPLMFLLPNVGGQPPASILCEPDFGLTAVETSCAGEPSTGSVPATTS